MKKRKLYKKKLKYAGFGAVLAIVLVGFLFYHNYTSKAKVYSAYINQDINGQQTKLPIMTSEDLALYNGDDPGKPIYIGFEGKVYDVSKGRDFYKKDGPYHYLAGKDSTAELELVGGNIIKKKYPVIGSLEK